MAEPLHILWTIGHSTRPWPDFVALLREVDIEVLVDVRRFAGSRHNPQYSRDVLPAALTVAGIGYRALPALGGRRRPAAGSVNLGWRVEAFRAYADHLASAEYRQGRAELMALAQEKRACVMCAEAVWWRCHRRLIADDFTVRGWTVEHLMGPGKHMRHTLQPGALLVDDVLRYPGAPALSA
ncbi:DUF488 domain-containing protein [Thermomonas sp.]|uniref:DUF488 domain-containing protein n=1 Tax=Thermomonas sp. TaxID=1971895 RepID=UPI001DBA10AE|nr:DUF488 domain-containing protein [Thermomonas sp.]MBZ0087757.1 DUF488 domain-containing protein [Thermomonas sp.]HRO63978.1 DUF488 domain-containing protein [Thermomonas sp.]